MLKRWAKREEFNGSDQYLILILKIKTEKSINCGQKLVDKSESV
jgi:hypothetical protein